MTLLLQTEGHVWARKRRRRAARLRQLQAMLEAAIAETEAEMQGRALRTISADLPAAAASASAGPREEPLVAAEAAAAFATATAAAADAAGLSEQEHKRLSNEIYVPTHSISDALVGQIRERSKLEARQALSSLAAKLRARARQDAAPDLHPDSFLEELRKLVPSEFLVAWAAWTTASDLISQDRITDGVRWAVWALYTVAAFLYVLWQLFAARREEECRDCLEPLDDMHDPHANGSSDTDVEVDMRSAAGTPWGTPLGTPAGTPAANGRAPREIESATRLLSTDSSALSLFQFVYEENWHRAPLLLDAGGALERSDVAFGAGASTRSAASAARRGALDDPAPSDFWLCMQALVSAIAFMLLSAATGHVYLKSNVVLWMVLAFVPLFPLFVQFLAACPAHGRTSRRR